MEKIVFLYDQNSPRIEQLRGILRNDYEILLAHDKKEIMSILKESFDDLSVLIVDSPSTKKYLNEVLEYIKEKNNYMFSLPVLVLTDDKHMHEDDKYLNNPVVDIIFFNDTEEIALRRIKNAVTLANSTSFDAFSMNSLRPASSFVETLMPFAFPLVVWTILRAATPFI